MPLKKNGSTPAPERKRSLRLHGTIARDIGVRIVSGRLVPGRILNGEIEASERLRVSRTAYREAVRILAAKGLVESRPKLGTRVSEARHWHLLDPDVISWMFADSPGKDVLSGLFELRTIIEPAACALAAIRRTRAQLQSLRESLDCMTRNSLVAEAGRKADREFHIVLLEASRNPFLISLSGSVATALLWMPIFQQRKGPLVRDPVPNHERVYAAVAAQDPQAASQAMTDLIQLALLDTSRRHGKSTLARRLGRHPAARLTQAAPDSYPAAHGTRRR
jgi:DNA-binding FadR family transcriptional regulator